MNIMTVFAHPDDEALGCGGVLLHLHGYSILSVFGSSCNRFDQAVSAAGRFSAKKPVILGLHDQKFEQTPISNIAQMIAEQVKAFKPWILFTHSSTDLNLDHRIIHDAVMVACRPMPELPDMDIYGCEVMSATGWSEETFKPRVYMEIDAEAKAEMLRDCYGTEMRPFPHARSLEAIKALAAYRGSVVGLPAAEAFEMIRSVNRA